MIGKTFQREEASEDVQAKGFDDYDLRQGDLMRGERATMGKSLLDVQRELKIKATYISAIENTDPSAFDTPGFIAGYVRSYARYLGLDLAGGETVHEVAGLVARIWRRRRGLSADRIAAATAATRHDQEDEGRRHRCGGPQ